MTSPGSEIRILLRLGVAALAASLSHVAFSEGESPAENVDHAGIISKWDSQSFERGRKLFMLACAPCHGTNGVQTINPQSRPFAVEKFKNGNDPYGIFRTITGGFKNMPSQLWMTPEQRYDVIQYIRERFLKTLNPSQYFAITRAYLGALPKFDPALARAAVDPSKQNRDFGPALESQLGTNVCDALTIKLSDDVTLSYDLHRMRLAGAWQGGFLDLSNTGHILQRGEGQPQPQGRPLRGLQQWYWAFGGRFDYPTEDLLPRGPLPPQWMKYQGHYVYNRQAILSYLIEGRQVLELPSAETINGTVLISHMMKIGPGKNPLRLCVAQLEGVGNISHGLVQYGQTVPRAVTGNVAGHLVMAGHRPKQGVQVLETRAGTTNRAPGSHPLPLGEGPGVRDPFLSDFVAAGAVGSTRGMQWQVDEHERLILTIPPDTKARVLRVICSAGTGAPDLERFGRYVSKQSSEPLTDPNTLTAGGARIWPLEIEMHRDHDPLPKADQLRMLDHRPAAPPSPGGEGRGEGEPSLPQGNLSVHGQKGDLQGAYVLDTIPVPFENPYGAWLRTSALAFFPDGRAVVTTYGGDVWIVSGLDERLEHVKWSRFAAGLYEPFGALVMDGKICVTCRNGIVRLHDLNGDGEADFYETLYADTDVSTFFHSFNFDLLQGQNGKLYYLKPGEYTDYKLPGAVLEITPDGSKAQVYCTGFRVPNGMGQLPDGRLTASDNQGNWMPASKINLLRRDGFYGYVQNLEGGGTLGDRWAPDGGRIIARQVKPPATFDQPIIWMPQEFDNSSSGQLWVDDPRFGPLSGRLLHTSFGKGWMYYLMLQEVGAVSQSAIVALPFQFDAGLMRARVNPADGQVYATGLSGWQGPAEGKDGCLQRLRYTGKPIRMLDDLKVQADGLHLRFNFALDPKQAADTNSYHIEQWNYLWSSNYGSDQYSLEHPGQQGHDMLTVAAARLDEDGRGVSLAISALRPVNQVEIKLSLAAADGTPFKELVYLTINAVPDR